MSKRFNGRARQLLNGEDRAKYGSLTTWENAAGQTITIHRPGPVRAGLRATAELVLGMDETFRLVSYSTPDTIYTDMSGGRADFVREPGASHRATYGMANPVALPEQIVLGAVGLAHLIHPRLVRLTANRHSRRS